MRSIKLTRKKSSSQLDMAPMMDMIFILLIFFIVTTSFVKESGVEVNRPVAKSSEKKETTNLVIGITDGGKVYIQGKVVDIRSVRANMERFVSESPDGSVVIAADKESRSGTVISVLDACRIAGIEKVSVATKNAE